MRVPSVGWAFFGLAVVAGVIYLLNRGVYIGSSVRMKMEEISTQTGKTRAPYYDKYCHYLLLNDIRRDWSDGSFDRDKAEDGFCSPIRNLN